MTKSLLFLIFLLQPLLSNATHQFSVPKDVYNELEENSVPKKKALVDYGSSDIKIHKNSEEKSFGKRDRVRHLQTLFEAFQNFLAAVFSFLLSILNPNPPVSIPTESPSLSPTIDPTSTPTNSSTAIPTASPTANPTSSPTANPTSSPTANPTSSPTASPSIAPTANPTASPTANPTSSPTSSPSKSPTEFPTTTTVVCDENNARIVGGTDAEVGRYPYQVNLNFFCGGTLIAPDYVLSAAHCSGANVVQIGRHDLANDDENYESISVEFEILHPDYNPDTFDNDFMLLKLANPSNYDTVTLDDGSALLNGGLDVTPIGWGALCEDGSSFPDILQEVELDIVDNTECQSDYTDDYYDGYYYLSITENMICASRTNKDTCQGDSGGPLLILGENAGDDIQVGVTSWGIGCANEEFPGVYARVSAAYDWIMATMAADTAFPSLAASSPPSSDPTTTFAPTSCCPSGQFPFKLEVFTDTFPSETSWSITNDDDESVVDENPVLEEETLYEEDYCLDNGCYTFTITDEFGDGICCGSGEGYFKGYLYRFRFPHFEGGDFSSIDSRTFCGEDPCSI